MHSLKTQTKLLLSFKQKDVFKHNNIFIKVSIHPSYVQSIDLHKYCWNNLAMFMFSAGNISQQNIIMFKNICLKSHNEKWDSRIHRRTSI